MRSETEDVRRRLLKKTRKGCDVTTFFVVYEYACRSVFSVDEIPKIIVNDLHEIGV